MSQTSGNQHAFLDIREKSDGSLGGASRERSPTDPSPVRILSLGATSWGFWYPSWDAWKFQRTLTYWISVMYLEGSILFLVGAIFSLTSLVEDDHNTELALVQVSYLMGGICFTVGSYAGILEVINIKRDGTRMLLWPCGPKWQLARQHASRAALAGYSSYFVGAVFYNVNTIAGFWPLTPLEDTLLGGMTAFLGASGFLIGSVIEGYANKVWRVRLTSASWWLCVNNFYGSLGFLVAGVSLLAKAEGDAAIWGVDVPYVIGSAGFMFGALCTMWLWKGEQYGLGFMPEMNQLGEREAPDENVLSMHEEYGCGRASPWQLPFLTMYLVNATAAVIDCGIAAFRPSASDSRNHSIEIFAAVLNFLLSHGVMLLGSVVHHIPTARPHSWLLVYMRIVLAMFTLNSWISVFKHLGY